MNHALMIRLFPVMSTHQSARQFWQCGEPGARLCPV
jgi:hypothetical protein